MTTRQIYIISIGLTLLILASICIAEDYSVKPIKNETVKQNSSIQSDVNAHGNLQPRNTRSNIQSTISTTKTSQISTVTPISNGNQNDKFDDKMNVNGTDTPNR